MTNTLEFLKIQSTDNTNARKKREKIGPVWVGYVCDSSRGDGNTVLFIPHRAPKQTKGIIPLKCDL